MAPGKGFEPLRRKAPPAVFWTPYLYISRPAHYRSVTPATKIVESNRRLGEQLRKLLDEQNLAEARRVMELATEIKQTAVALATNPPDDKTFIWVEAEPMIDMPWERPLWTPPLTTTYAGVEPTTAVLDLSAANLEALFSQFYVDKSRLRRHIATLLEQKPLVTLGEITADYPITQGLAEVITYISLAAQNEPHQIDDNDWEEVEMVENGRIIRLPLVTFKKEL